MKASAVLVGCGALVRACNESSDGSCNWIVYLRKVQFRAGLPKSPNGITYGVFTFVLLIFNRISMMRQFDRFSLRCRCCSGQNFQGGIWVFDIFPFLHYGRTWRFGTSAKITAFLRKFQYRRMVALLPFVKTVPVAGTSRYFLPRAICEYHEK